MTQAATVERFTRVDASVDPKFFVRFVDMANEMASVQACKRRMAALLQPRVGQRILDLGCGTGDDARALARLVAPGGEVVGVDNSEVMLAEARRRAVGLSLSLQYRLGDAQRLDLPDDTFDGARTERTFMHLEAPERTPRRWSGYAARAGRSWSSSSTGTPSWWIIPTDRRPARFST
jgi:ubiquinone/menaquinone biosynthesis C-methylase UbiE